MQKHKILAFLLALLVSVGLWVYAVTVVNPNDTANIKGVRVRLVGLTDLQNHNLMLTGGEEQYVNVEISGRRSDLKELNSNSLEAIADVSNIDSPGEFEVSWTLDPPATVASGDIRLMNSSSNKIKVKVSEYKERPEIPITVEYAGTLPEGYIRDPETLSTETLAVSGPAEEVNAISKAVITVDLGGTNRTLEGDFAYTFVDGNGAELTMSEYVTVSAPTVHVAVPVLPYKQVELKVKIKAGGGATEDDVRCVIEPSTIGVTGSEEVLEKLSELVIKEIDLAQVSAEQTWTVKPELPEGVTNRASDTAVKITLRFSGLITKKFIIPCSDIERQNDVASLSFAEQSVEVLSLIHI